MFVWLKYLALHYMTIKCKIYENNVVCVFKVKCYQLASFVVTQNFKYFPFNLYSECTGVTQIFQMK